MSGFELVPVHGGAPIHLPPGETVLGRGPVLGVSDKRVSRHHGLLENLNGRLRLKATHLNPCFLQSSLTDEPRPLHRDSWCRLHHGDLFSLLPGQFLFRVVAVGGDDRAPRNSQTFEEETDQRQVSPGPDEGPAPGAGQNRGSSSLQEKPTSAALMIEEANSPIISFNKGGSALPTEAEDDHSEVGSPGPRKRVLPAWMTAASTSLTAQSVNRSKTPEASTSSKQAPELREEEPSKKRRKQRPSEEPVQNQSGPSGEAEAVAMEVEEEGNTATQTSGVSESEDRKSKPQTTKPQSAECDWSNSGSASASTRSRPRLRTPCPYGKDCYRKNPIHFQESSHPGDTDYEEEEGEEGASDRPECPYGTDCYRKNPLHRKEYKHTRKPARATRSVTETVTTDDDDSDDSNDSDYVPLDSDDVRRLQKEAKEFLKRRK